jgi:ribosomal protein S18 acetylase RimI-like enzyme
VDIVELHSHHEARAIALWDAAALTRPWNPPELDFRRALAGPSSTVLGAIDHDRIVGTVMVGHDGHPGWVYYLATDPTHRRTGVGRALMDAATSWLTARDIPKLQLMVRTTNGDALGFYRSLGYESQDVTVLGRWIDGRSPSD